MTEQFLGIVKAIKRVEGFAFITHATGDYFMHKSAMQVTSPTTWDELSEADPVAFTPIEGPKGPRAIEVRVLSRAELLEHVEQERQAKERARLADAHRAAEEGDQSAVVAAEMQHRRKLGLA